MPRRDCAPSEESGSKPAADECPDDAEEDRDDAAGRVPPWDQELRQCPGYEPEKYPVQPERQTLYLRETISALRNPRCCSATRGHPVNPEQDERPDYSQ
jgi:hypothetical protein